MKKTSKKKSGWSRKEDDLLLQAYKKFKGSWTKIASFVGNDKSGKDCQQRIHCYSSDKNNN
jgi:hypothetical protein